MVPRGLSPTPWGGSRGHPRARLAHALALAVALVGLGLPAPAIVAAAGSAPRAPVCSPGGPPVEYRGRVTEDDAKTYRYLPFRVARGTTRVEVGYEWSELEPISDPFNATTIDLGLRDGPLRSSTRGFRGWSGSRQGKLHAGQPRIFVQADGASRSYTPGPVEPRIWHVELGIAAVSTAGARWRVEVACLDPRVGRPPRPDPVDPNHVARTEPGWYHGDLHMHGYHSSVTGPTYERFVKFARRAGLDFLPVTEYVVGRHWDELGRIQRANPDLVIWPGREVITYFGHAVVLGETEALEYRHGYRGTTMRRIQEEARADGALFQVAHPTTFAGALFERFCRGCAWTIDDIDWGMVDTIEVLTGPVIQDLSEIIGGPPKLVQNPFAESAIELWEDLLLQGFKITAVSGSDDKEGPGYGMNATAVFARELSRPALIEALRAGHAYVRTLGVRGERALGFPPSPTLEMTAVTADGQRGMFGDSLTADQAEVTVTVTGGLGQTLEVIRDGEMVQTVSIDADPFVFSFTATRAPDEGPLGTFWRVQTRTTALVDAAVLTTIGNPIFLTGP